jgi:hypothetical protein
MASALEHFRVRNLCCNDFSWSDRIAELVARPLPGGARPTVPARHLPDAAVAAS